MLRYIVLVYLVLQVSETEVNGQFESVCESVFSEVESQAMDALDLPGCFRTRSHSYLRAIQAGFSQDDDCVPSMTSSTVTSTIRSATGKWACLVNNHAHLCLVSACLSQSRSCRRIEENLLTVFIKTDSGLPPSLNWAQLSMPNKFGNKYFLPAVKLFFGSLHFSICLLDGRWWNYYFWAIYSFTCTSYWS